MLRQGELLIQAVPGAQVQGQRENGYLIANGHNCLYYEPHLAPDNLQNYLRSPVDSLLIPVVGQAFPLLGEVIMGPERALALVQQLQPRAVIPTAIGDLNLSGFLPPLIRTLGTLEEFAQQLQQTAPQITFYQPAPGGTVSL
jgi:L-ascorbate metabolism protein UlaG (beta-lactamase superfamily)